MAEGYRQSCAASSGPGKPRRHRELTGGTATSPDGTAAPCSGEARETEGGAAAMEAEYAAAKPDTAAASSIVGYACSRWESRTWAWSREADWWMEDGKGEIWDPLWTEEGDRVEKKERMLVHGNSIINPALWMIFFFFEGKEAPCLKIFLRTRKTEANGHRVSRDSRDSD